MGLSRSTQRYDKHIAMGIACYVGSYAAEKRPSYPGALVCSKYNQVAVGFVRHFADGSCSRAFHCNDHLACLKEIELFLQLLELYRCLLFFCKI